MEGTVLGVVLASLLCSSVLAIDYCRPSESCWPSDAIIQDFKTRMNATMARVMTKDDKDWAAQFLTFNQAVAEEPGIIIFLGDIDQIREALKFAYQYNIEVKIVSSGHSFLGRCGGDGVMQISVHYMKGIKVNLNCTENALGCMNVQAGVQWIEAYNEANKYDRLVVGGSAPTVSVTGWTLGGGHSPMSRMFGMGADNVLSFHLITADLSEVWTSAEGTKIKKEDGSYSVSNDTSLFWALRGGGSAFGIILDMDIKMHKDNKIAQAICTYSYIENEESKLDVILNSVGDLMSKAPNTFSGYVLPSAGCYRTSCGGSVTTSVIHYGSVSESPADADWIKAFTTLPHKISEQGVKPGSCQLNEYDSFYEYEMTIPNVTYTTVYIGGSLLQEDLISKSTSKVISDHYLDTYNKAKVDGTANQIGTFIWVGGAVKNTPPGEVAVNDGWRKALFTYSSSFAYDKKTLADPSPYKDDIRKLHADLEPYSRGKYYNEAEPDMSPEKWKKEFWGLDMYDKLLRIKKQWDPRNRFTCNQCVGSDWEPATDDIIG